MVAFLIGLGIYLGIGLCFAAAFAWRGAAAIDPAARGAPPTFRLIIVPGAAALWPLLAAKWARSPAREPAREPGEHAP